MISSIKQINEGVLGIEKSVVSLEAFNEVGIQKGYPAVRVELKDLVGLNDGDSDYEIFVSKETLLEMLSDIVSNKDITSLGIVGYDVDKYDIAIANFGNTNFLTPYKVKGVRAWQYKLSEIDELEVAFH